MGLANAAPAAALALPAFDSSAEVIRLVVLMYVRFPFSLRNVEDLLGRCQSNGNLSPLRRSSATPSWD